LELMLLFLAPLACIWGAVGLIRPTMLPNHVTVINLELLGGLLANSFSGESRYGIVKYFTLSFCFGVASVAFLIFDKSRLGFVFGVLICLCCIYLGSSNLRKGGWPILKRPVK
jgi:hypothetical protein